MEFQVHFAVILLCPTGLQRSFDRARWAAHPYAAFPGNARVGLNQDQGGL